MLALDQICQAQHRLRQHVHCTPLVQSHALSERLGVPVWLKLEFLQKTGSFKPRGAFNKVLSLSDADRQRGSSGPPPPSSCRQPRLRILWMPRANRAPRSS